MEVPPMSHQNSANPIRLRERAPHARGASSSYFLPPPPRRGVLLFPPPPPPGGGGAKFKIGTRGLALSVTTGVDSSKIDGDAVKGLRLLRNLSIFRDRPLGGPAHGFQPPARCDGQERGGRSLPAHRRCRR